MSSVRRGGPERTPRLGNVLIRIIAEQGGDRRQHYYARARAMRIEHNSHKSDDNAPSHWRPSPVDATAGRGAVAILVEQLDRVAGRAQRNRRGFEVVRLN